ncbi:hypothetical protein HYX04_04685 [Candidatus Woesearchaeota archaeon]|nr:hypothetical protein [Candidatus Woesearchaeota archaeon]
MILEEILTIYANHKHIAMSDLKEREIEIEAIKRNQDEYGFILREGMISYIVEETYKVFGDLQFSGKLKREGNWFNSHGYKLSGYLRVKGETERISLF